MVMVVDYIFGPVDGLDKIDFMLFSIEYKTNSISELCRSHFASQNSFLMCTDTQLR